MLQVFPTHTWRTVWRLNENINFHDQHTSHEPSKGNLSSPEWSSNKHTKNAITSRHFIIIIMTFNKRVTKKIDNSGVMMTPTSLSKWSRKAEFLSIVTIS